jgi:hypothetical protein
MRWQYGPVPEAFEILYGGMICKKMFKVDEAPNKYGQPSDKFHSPIHAKTSLFTKDEMKLIDKWVSVLKKNTSKELTDLSHKEKGYADTPHDKPISYHFAKDLKAGPPTGIKGD